MVVAMTVSPELKMQETHFPALAAMPRPAFPPQLPHQGFMSSGIQEGRD